MTSQYLESAINSVPNLIWYKTKDGIHEKVNDSFCKTVNKTKAQVEGADTLISGMLSTMTQHVLNQSVKS